MICSIWIGSVELQSPFTTNLFNKENTKWFCRIPELVFAAFQEELCSSTLTQHCSIIGNFRIRTMKYLPIILPSRQWPPEDQRSVISIVWFVSIHGGKPHTPRARYAWRSAFSWFNSIIFPYTYSLHCAFIHTDACSKSRLDGKPASCHYTSYMCASGTIYLGWFEWYKICYGCFMPQHSATWSASSG